MESVVKFSDLKIGSTYCVQGYDGPNNSKYGITYILKISEINSDISFDIWSTNKLSEYITTFKPTTKFTFTVGLNERNNKPYPVIEGYKKERKYTMLD